MISLKGQRIVDLSWPIRSRVTRLDGSIEEGTRDVYDMPWIVEETVNQKDNTIEHLVGGNVRTIPDWPIAGTSGHMGSHIQLGVGHNDNWSDLPDGMLGIWDMPLDTYYGEACVCRLSHLKGEPILPTHLSNVRMGDIVLLTSPYAGEDQPVVIEETARWLAEEMQIKMFGPGVPGISWETNMNAPEPDNSPTHRAMTGNNVPIVYPLVNIENLTSDRVFFMSLPLNVERLEGSWVRAIAIEEVL